jgi:pre-mRNA-splicing factor SYF2
LLAVFNQKTSYAAYKKRAKNIEVDMDAWNGAKENDREFYSEASSLQDGKLSTAVIHTLLLSYL